MFYTTHTSRSNASTLTAVPLVRQPMHAALRRSICSDRSDPACAGVTLCLSRRSCYQAHVHKMTLGVVFAAPLAAWSAADPSN